MTKNNLILVLTLPFVMLLTPMVYAQTVTIGAQVWTAKNLNVTKFRNGEAIPQAKTNEEWKAAGDNKQAAWCYYDNDSANVAKYGILYNWYAVNDPRGLAPAGYHIPSDAEWTTLSTFLGGEYAAGSKMKSTSGWEKNGNGNNSSGFSGLPGGTRVSGGTFDTIGINGNWWSSSEFGTYYSWTRFLSYSSGLVLRNRSTKTNGFSVRCLRD